VSVYAKWGGLTVALGCVCLVIVFVNHRKSTPGNTPNSASAQPAPASELTAPVSGSERTESSGSRRVESLGEGKMADSTVAKPTYIPVTPDLTVLDRESEESQQKLSGLALHVIPSFVTERSPERIQTDYLCGMPIILYVRLVNKAAKDKEPDAMSIKVPRWAEDVCFDVTLSSNTIDSFIVESILERSEKDGEQQLDLSMPEVEGVWIVEGQTTAELAPGLYRVAPSFRSIHAEPFFVKLSKPSEPDSGLQIMMKEASALYMKAQYEKSIELADKAMQEGGVFVKDTSGGYAILLSAGSHEALGNYEEALALYKKFKARAPDGDPYLVDGLILRMEELLQKKRAVIP